MDRHGSHPHTAAAPLRVLVVANDRDTAESLALLFRLDGHEAQTASDAPAALARAAAEPPDVAIVDLGLPGPVGHELAQRLRGLGRERRPLLIAVTSRLTEADRRRASEDGVDIYLVKPADPEFLLGLLRRFAGLLDPPAEARRVTVGPGAPPGLSEPSDRLRAGHPVD
jgi:DNA-binding response OmpR family regulator